MKYYHSEKRSKANKLEKCCLCAFYLVIAPRYFSEQLFKQKIKNLNQIAGSRNNLGII